MDDKSPTNQKAGSEPVMAETTTAGSIDQITIERHYATSGPIPDPEVFARYKDVNPDIPIAIIEQWCKQCDHTRKMDLLQVDMLGHEMREEFNLRKRGQWFAVLLCVVLGLASAGLIALDKIVAGSIFGAVGAAGGIGSLISYLTNNCRDKKADAQVQAQEE